jgi:hypothetical protein
MVGVDAEYLGLSAQGWRGMISNWWDLVRKINTHRSIDHLGPYLTYNSLQALAYILIASILLGSGYLVLLLCKKARQYWLVS